MNTEQELISALKATIAAKDDLIEFLKKEIVRLTTNTHTINVPYIGQPIQPYQPLQPGYPIYTTPYIGPSIQPGTPLTDPNIAITSIGGTSISEFGGGAGTLSSIDYSKITNSNNGTLLSLAK